MTQPLTSGQPDEIRRLRMTGDVITRHLELHVADNKPMPTGYWKMLLDRMLEAGFVPAKKGEAD